MAECKGCRGTGKCGQCDGKGGTYSMTGKWTCKKCGGSGNYTVCKGSGK